MANTRIPARAASTDVAATVVPAVRLAAMASPRSRLLTLMTLASRAIRSSSASDRPALGTPSMTAMVAGVTPLSASSASNDLAAPRLPGRGRPCEMIVDSSATTGRPASRASLTARDSSGTWGHAPTLPSRRPGHDGCGAEARSRIARPSLPWRRCAPMLRSSAGGAARLRRLLEGVGEAEQAGLAPAGAEERDADREAADVAERDADRRPAGHRARAARCRRRSGRRGRSRSARPGWRSARRSRPGRAPPSGSPPRSWPGELAAPRSSRYTGSSRSPLVASAARKISWPNRASTQSAFRSLKSIRSASVPGSSMAGRGRRTRPGT